jgi:HlyD family type I secretion membrane fusion protein
LPQLAVHSTGAIVSQAQPALMVVPDGEGIALDVALLNRDAGFVRPGQPVEIKVEAFPFTRYGTVPGEVEFVSGDAVENADSDPTRRSPAATDRAVTGRAQEEQGPVYSVRIKPLVDSIFVDGREVALTPGMAVTAEIKTGKRRVIGYLLDPVMRYWGEGLRER